MAELAPGLVTIFGGSGFVGAQVARAMARRGWRIRIAVRKPALAHELRMAGDVGQVQLTLCDITKKDDVVAALQGADAAINLVGILCETAGRKFDAIHVEGSRNIAEAAAAAGVKQLVQMSALGADVNSAADYARTKGEAEQAVRAAFPSAVVVRPSVIFGSEDQFLNRFGNMAARMPVMPIIEGESRLQPVHVLDVAEAVARLTVNPQFAGETFELGGPAVWTMKQVIDYVLAETGRDRLAIALPTVAAKAVASLTQIPAAIGLTPALTVDQVKMLATDNVVSEGAKGFADLGIEPVGMKAIAEGYLWRYRNGGQYATVTA
ncbi:complex I NDUFA9 subunit family protein [uncultured Brevundimonas sp.]|uniref:complex I NDUFA9 subunit family protein n=1 Tax=uncultured Brevundimonas sp. TaxID=213418 RepID=UPI002615E1D6|nr:complex I NDUFA9 subunit family protein [uncultured Brevundimonas sp.]